MTTALSDIRATIAYWRELEELTPVEAMEALGIKCPVATWVEVEVIAELRYRGLKVVPLKARAAA